MISKNDIRQKILEKRNLLDSSFVEKNSDIIIKKLDDYLESNKNVLIFYDFKNEVQVSKLAHKNIFNNKFYLTKVINKEDMIIGNFDKNNIIKNNFGYFEPVINKNEEINPTIIDLVIVPGIVFDKNKNRIGFGAGYYDRFLPKLNNKCIKIGVCYDFQLLESISTEKHDVKMDIIITEQNIIL